MIKQIATKREGKMKLAVGVIALVFLFTTTAVAGSPGWYKTDHRLRLQYAGDLPAWGGMAHLFVQTVHVQKTMSVVESMGGRVGTVAGDIITVHIPLWALPDLADRPEVLKMEAGQRVRLRLDKLGETYEYIYKTWLPQSGHELDGHFDMEYYDERFKFASDDSEFDIYVAVK